MCVSVQGGAGLSRRLPEQVELGSSMKGCLAVGRGWEGRTENGSRGPGRGGRVWGVERAGEQEGRGAPPRWVLRLVGVRVEEERGELTEPSAPLDSVEPLRRPSVSVYAGRRGWRKATLCLSS